MDKGAFPQAPAWARVMRAFRALLVLVLATLAIAPVHAAPNDTGSATAVAEVAVVTPLSLIQMRNLDFGRIGPTTTAGSIVINPNDSTCTSTGGLLHLGGCQAAQFGGMGARNMLVRLNTPGTITLTGPGANMTIDTITLDTSPDLQLQAGGNGNGNGNSGPGNGNNRRYRIVTSSGIFSFNLGGTLRVNANQAPGVYTATFSVTAIYQ